MSAMELTTAAIASGVGEVERLQGKGLVEADGADLLADGAADDVVLLALGEEGC